MQAAGMSAFHPEAVVSGGRFGETQRSLDNQMQSVTADRYRAVNVQC
jgi:hypothetical protein